MPANRSDSRTAFRLVIACGGTGGHLFPGIAVAQAAKARGWETLLLISEKQIDSLAIEAHQDLNFARIPAIGMPKPMSPAMVKFLWRFVRTRRHCARLLREFQAKGVLGMGGFTSLPPVMAGRRMKLRTFIHESNAIPGKANRLTARYCTAVLVGMEACAKHFPGMPVQVTGTPVRAGMQRAPVDEARRYFQLDPDKPVALIMGGSQGARGVNTALIEALPKLDPTAVQLLHITGPQEYEPVCDALSRHPDFQAWAAPFCHRMDLAYSAADVAVSRAGASSLTELSAFGVPTVLVPYPYAADDHQRRNAEVYRSAGAALSYEEADLTGGSGKLGLIINALLKDDARRAAMSAAMRKLASPDAAERICQAIADGGKRP